MRKIIPYKKHLVPLAKKLRQNMTMSEILLWQELKNKQLGVRFSRQIPIDQYIVDFYCKDLMIAIEIDGESHWHDEKPKKDEIRQQRLESLGVKIIRFEDADIKSKINWVVNEILLEIQDYKPTPSPSKEGS